MAVKQMTAWALKFAFFVPLAILLGTNIAIL